MLAHSRLKSYREGRRCPDRETRIRMKSSLCARSFRVRMRRAVAFVPHAIAPRADPERIRFQAPARIMNSAPTAAALLDDTSRRRSFP